MSDIGIEKTGHVALVEIRRPPNNFFDIPLIKDIAGAFESFDEDSNIRAIVLAAQGKAFCAGANFGDGSTLDAQGRRSNEPGPGVAPLYIEGNRLFRTKKPIIAAVHGAAVGGGLGLAMVADFRVTCPEARFCANFTRLGFHPGFGLTVTLPAVIGETKAALMFYTSRRVPGDEAYAMGLADVLVRQDQVRDAAIKLAAEIGENSPLGLIATRMTMRGGIADRVREATDHELEEQTRLRKTDDFREGVKSVSGTARTRFQGTVSDACTLHARTCKMYRRHSAAWLCRGTHGFKTVHRGGGDRRAHHETRLVRGPRPPAMHGRSVVPHYDVAAAPAVYVARPGRCRGLH